MNIHRTNDPLRTATENVINEERRDAYENKHLLDVTDPQEILPEDYQAELDKDPGYQKWLDELDQTPF